MTACNAGTIHSGRLTPLTERPDKALAIVEAWRKDAAAPPGG